MTLVGLNSFPSIDEPPLGLVLDTRKSSRLGRNTQLVRHHPPDSGNKRLPCSKPVSQVAISKSPGQAKLSD